MPEVGLPATAHAAHAPRTWRVAGGFHPGYSLLGRFLRRRSGDVLRAEAQQILVLTFAVLAALGLHFVAANLSGEAGALALLLPGAVLLAALLAGMLGFAPSASLILMPSGLRVEREAESVEVAYDEIQEIRVIPALLHHRHYRRYAATRSFTPPRPQDELLLLLTVGGPLVLGLQPDEAGSFRAALEARRVHRGALVDA